MDSVPWYSICNTASASRKERHPSDLTSSKCTSGDTASSKKDSNQQPVAEQAGPAASLHSKGLNSVKTSGVVDTKVSQLPLDSKSRQSTASPNFSRSTLQNQSLKPMNKVPQLAADSQGAGIVKGGGYPMRESSSFSNQGHRLSPNNGPCDFQSDRLVKGGYPYLMRENSSFSNQGKRVFPNNGPTRNMSNGRTWDGNDRFKFGEKFQRNRELKPCCETNRGPRARGGQTSLSSPPKNDPLGLRLVQREKYNLPNFETKYENAKFFVIKSYNEEDIHKSIKYDVWASTPHGNRKLDAAFHDAERISSETSKTCPIFLFFSANGSGQFVGLAEMTGPVDFEKDMDFWQKNKWNGFLPLEWHIIKDIPNNQLRHIILENNENKPVTYTRDTQEVGFKQGSEMLAIFKSYPAKTMLLDDFDFYENQEKSPPDRSCKAASPQIITYGDRFLSGYQTLDEFVLRNSEIKAAKLTITEAALSAQSETSITVYNSFQLFVTVDI
ncbi:YTH domain [Macleaya cordata]|uniref:YTH domain-containing family protein n=1 Tax=Macleaya cordata TaxID=56857 RepID=A0A200Q5D6_MACCD|nr:YTH domain [Macleaya cordata]